MNRDPSDLWFVAYDIREPNRLRRVHRLVKREATALQYSAFCLLGSEAALLRLLHQLAEIINPAKDDVRAYRLPHTLKVWKLGRQGLPDGLMMAGSEAVSALLQSDAVDQEAHERQAALLDHSAGEVWIV